LLGKLEGPYLVHEEPKNQSLFQKWLFEGARLQPRRSEPYKTWASAPEGIHPCSQTIFETRFKLDD
jgi:hypothetical protein